MIGSRIAEDGLEWITEEKNMIEVIVGNWVKKECIMFNVSCKDLHLFKYLIFSTSPKMCLPRAKLDPRTWKKKSALTSPEVRIYKRKQESKKKERKHALGQESDQKTIKKKESF